MKKLLSLVLCGFMMVSAFTEVTVVLKDLRGKVEVKPLGKNWMPATEGMKVDMLATISTGFDSSVTLVIDKNQVRLEPLTRLTVDKILEKSGSLSTSLHLRVGNVSASVKSSTGVSQTFQVTSPQSTASVRGAAFDFDGLVVVVREGVVQIIVGKPKRDILLVAAGGGDTGNAETEAVTAEAALAELVSMLQAEFPNDTFEILDGAGVSLSPVSDTPPVTPGSVFVAAGQSVELVIDYSSPDSSAEGSSASLGAVAGSTQAPVVNSGVGPTGTTGSGAAGPVTNSPPAPTTGRITVKWSD